MSHSPLAPPAEQYVERMGLIWEAEGLPRIAGRIVGLLALQPEPISLDAIVAALGVSKGSVSTDARRLERMALIERSSRAGDRRDYYAIAPDMPARVVAQKLADLRRLQSALAEARDLPGTHPRVRARLQAFGDFHQQVLEHMSAIVPLPDAGDAGGAPRPTGPTT